MTSEQVLISIVSGIGALLVAAIGWLGRRDETNASASKTLIDGQTTRIEKLETRLDAVEAELRTTRVELQRIQSHAGDLRTALRNALAWIAEALEHLASPGTVAPPAAPDVDDWQALIDAQPRARNPPD